MQQDISHQPTLPLTGLTPTPLSTYLKAHDLLWVDVERASGVPCVVVWKADHGRAVGKHHAQKIREGLYRLTGIPYAGPIDVLK